MHECCHSKGKVFTSESVSRARCCECLRLFLLVQSSSGAAGNKSGVNNGAGCLLGLSALLPVLAGRGLRCGRRSEKPASDSGKQKFQKESTAGSLTFLGMCMFPGSIVARYCVGLASTCQVTRLLSGGGSMISGL